jgi:hypothetical protein
MMARASRKLAIPHLTQHAAERLLSDDDAEFLENPLAEIDDPLAHDPMNRKDRPALERLRMETKSTLELIVDRHPLAPPSITISAPVMYDDASDAR